MYFSAQFSEAKRPFFPPVYSMLSQFRLPIQISLHLTGKVCFNPIGQLITQQGVRVNWPLGGYPLGAIGMGA